MISNNNRFPGNKLIQIAQQIRKDILEISYQAHTGHIGPALSVADILTVLYFDILNVSPSHPTDPERDRFILSKGHAAAALYSVLYRKGYLDKKQLFGFCRDGGMLAVHPDYNPAYGIELTTGSLGHGLSVGAGLALGLAKTRASPPRVFVLISDAELNEGSTWEGVMFAAYHKLNNLILLVDDNGQQAFGKTKEVLDLEPIAQKLEMFGWQTATVNGHDTAEILNALKKIPSKKSSPYALVCKTILGYPVSFMMRKVDWHYLPIDTKLYKQALKDIDVPVNKLIF
jgi:transketolase